MIKLRPFRQTPGLCGPASLKMVMEHYGVSVPEKEIARISGASHKTGVSQEGLIKAAKHFGFDVFSKEKSSFNDLRHFINKGVPVIVDWFSEDEGHYSVVVDIDSKNIVLMDPEVNGERKMPLEKFQRLWFDFPGKFIKEPKDIILRLIIAVIPPKK